MQSEALGNFGPGNPWPEVPEAYTPTHPTVAAEEQPATASTPHDLWRELTDLQTAVLVTALTATIEPPQDRTEALQLQA